MELTREGWLQPWARLRDNENDEQQRLAAMPEFRVLNRVRTVKPGAGVIATTGTGQEQKLPALAVQRLGNGHTAALAIGDLWRWGMQKPETHNDMDKFWRQTLRWLIADVPERITVQATQKADETNQPVTIQIRVRDKAFEPMDNVAVAIEVREVTGGSLTPDSTRDDNPQSTIRNHVTPDSDPGPQSASLTATPVPAERGLFEAVYLPRTSGGYSAQVTVAGADGAKLGDAQTAWTVDLEAREYPVRQDEPPTARTDRPPDRGPARGDGRAGQVRPQSLASRRPDHGDVGPAAVGPAGDRSRRSSCSRSSAFSPNGRCAAGRGCRENHRTF